MTTPYPDWSWRRIRYELEERGHVLANLARKLHVTPAAIAHIQHIPNPRIQAVVAQAIGLSPLAIWPSRYTADGQPVRRTDWLRAHGRDFNGKKLPAAEQKETAA